jgi:hypothetical protein
MNGTGQPRETATAFWGGIGLIVGLLLNELLLGLAAGIVVGLIVDRISRTGRA